MSAEQLIDGVLSGAIKVADVDPALQWGMLGAGVGGAGGLVKSLASGKSLKEVLKSTLGGAALGGGVGLSGAAGAQILGAKPPQVSGVLKPTKEYKGDFSSSAGLGLAGAGGLLAGAHAEDRRDRGEALRKFIGGGGTAKDLFGGKEEAAFEAHPDLIAELKSQGKSKEEIADLLKSKNVDIAMGDELIDNARRMAGPYSAKPKDFSSALTGESPRIKAFISRLENIARDHNLSTHRVMAERILDKIRGPKSVLQESERFAASPRFTQFLKNFKGPKGVRNLAMAAGGIGLGTYGLSGLGEKLWGKKE